MSQNKVTFIFPTKNRKEKAFNFINKNLIIMKELNPIFLIVTSDILEKQYFEKKFKLVKNIKIILQKESGFMNACFESIKYVDTNYCTFLYDDDEISPYAIDIFKKVFLENIAMGYGVLVNQNTSIEFKPLSINMISSEKIISAYFGLDLKNVKFMPVSPICLIFQSEFLLHWKKILLEFCAGNNLRKEILLKLNIGPDLILYLHQIIKKNKISFAKPFIAKFIEHKGSMSYILGKNKLLIGYWLAKKSLVDLNELKNKRLNKTIFTFLYLSGAYILFYNLFLSLINNDNYFKEFRYEMKSLRENKNFSFSFLLSLKIIINKVLRF